MSLNFKKIGSREYRTLWLILAVAVLIRLFFLRFEYAVGWDEVNYLKLGATGAIKGFRHVLHPYWSPMYPLFVAAMGKFIANYELAGRLVSVIFGSLLVIPVYLFALKYVDALSARLTAWLVALFPSFIESSVSALTEAVYIFMAITGILLGFAAIRKKSLALTAVVGALFSIAYLTRPEGFGLLMVFGGLTVCLAGYEIIKHYQYRQSLMLLVAVATFFIISSPYVLYLHQVTGKWTLSSKGSTNLQGGITAMQRNEHDRNPWLLLNEDNTRLPDDDIYHTGEFLKYWQSNNNSADQESGTKVVKITPFLIIKRFVKNYYIVITTGIGQVLGIPILALVVLGLLGQAWDRRRIWREIYLLSYVFFFWIMLIPVFHFTERYFLPMVPVVLIWAALGMRQLGEWFRQTGTGLLNINRKLFSIVAAGLLFLLVGSFIIVGMARMAMKNPDATEKWAEPVEQKKAGLWLKQHCNKTPEIMAWNHAVSFYAGNYDIKASISIPQNRLERVLAYARHRGADYLVLNEKNKADFPTINFLLDENQAPPDLKLVYKDDTKPGLKTVIYEILPDSTTNNNVTF